MRAVASPASGHVGTCPPPAFDIFFSLGYTFSGLVWYYDKLLTPFLQAYSLWNNTITGIMVRVQKLTLFLLRDAMCYSVVFAVVWCPSVHLSNTFVFVYPDG